MIQLQDNFVTDARVEILWTHGQMRIEPFWGSGKARKKKTLQENSNRKFQCGNFKLFSNC